jgi:hypothetical protein
MALKHRLGVILGIWLSLSMGCSSVEPLPTLIALPPTARYTVFASATPTPSATLTATPATLYPTDTPFVTRTPIIPSATLTDTPTLTFTPSTTPTRTPLQIDFEGVFPIDLTMRQPLLNELIENIERLPNYDLWTVSAYRAWGDWAKITLVPTELVEESWENVERYQFDIVEVILSRQPINQWTAYLYNTPELNAITSQIPSVFIAYPPSLPPMRGAYLFPWDKDKVWWAITGWHDGNSLDFQPQLRTSFGVLASESGYLREICRDEQQSMLQILHADGNSTFYLHVSVGQRVREGVLDHPVVRGQFLGNLIYDNVFASVCGKGGSRHLHFSVTDRNLTIDGYALEDIASVASCCASPPTFISSNERYWQP